MKERFAKFINKNLKMIVVIAIIVAMAMGLLLMLISGNDEERDQVPVDPTAEQQEDKKDKKERTLAQSNEHPGVSDVALNMYNARVDDISDTAQVAQLLEASDMREELGNYLVTLKIKGDSKTLVIAFDKKLLDGEDSAFDEVATWYAEQFLALIEEAEIIKWTYMIDGHKEKTEKTLTLKQANELLETDIKSYSETPELVQTLLNNQKGIV